MDELIVEFRRGVSEDDAKRVISHAGAKVRRRMRSDHEDQVMLLIKLDSTNLEAVEKKLSGHKDVVHTERNNAGYGII